MSKRSDSYALKVLVVFCYLAMFSYFQVFFYQFEFENFPWVKGQRTQRVLSVILSCLLGIGTFLIIQAAIEAIVANH